MRSIELFTIGHSNHSLDQFLGLLQQHEIGVLVDIRRFPGSRKFPQFNSENLTEQLKTHDIEYIWMEALGGRRPKVKDFQSPNMGLHNTSFRNYADYMLSAEFRSGIVELTAIAASKRTAIMCSESVFWRCHRRLVSDFVVANDGSINHIFPAGQCKSHSLTKEAKLEGGTLTYPGEKTLFD